MTSQQSRLAKLVAAWSVDDRGDVSVIPRNLIFPASRARSSSGASSSNARVYMQDAPDANEKYRCGRSAVF